MTYLTATTTFLPHLSLYRTTIRTPRRTVSIHSLSYATSLTEALRALGLPEHFND